MFNWSLWLVHVFLSTLFTAGAVTFYNRAWHFLYRNQEANVSDSLRLAGKIIISIAPTVIAVLLELCSIADPINWVMYINLGLFVLIYTVIDEDTNLQQYIGRWVVVVAFYLYHHLLTDWTTWATLVLIVATAVITRRYRTQVRYNWLANGALALVAAASFWQLNNLGMIGSQFDPVLTFMIINSFAFVHMSLVHAQDVEQDRVAEQANYDALTNARSYALFRTEAAKMFREARKHLTPFTVVMLDIDHFKDINDRYGHAAGNAVLVRLAEIINDVLQDDKFEGVYEIYRTGGEEFNISFPDNDVAAVLPIIEECWQTIRGTNFEFDGQQIHVTISMGVTSMVAMDSSFDDVYQRADRNLYQSKRSGRDTITVEGVTRYTDDQQKESLQYAYFVQPIIDPRDNHVVGNELLLRTYDSLNDRWILPQKKDLGRVLEVCLIGRVLEQVPVRSLTLNLAAEQFASVNVANKLANFAKTAVGLEVLVIELTTPPTIATMAQIAPIYAAASVFIALDNVENIATTAEVEPLLPYIRAVKYALPTVHQQRNNASGLSNFKMWADFAREHKLIMSVAGIETELEARQAKDCGAYTLEGYYYGRPERPQMD